MLLIIKKEKKKIYVPLNICLRLFSETPISVFSITTLQKVHFCLTINMEFSPHVRTQVKNDNALNKGLISIEGVGQVCDRCSHRATPD